MKNIVQLLCCICISTFLFAQPKGFNVDNVTHVSFKYDDGGISLEESSHYQPGILAFWANNMYNTGSWHSNYQFYLFDPDQSATLDISSLVFRRTGGAPFEERVRLDYDGLNFVNGASWGALDAHVYGSGGQLDLYTGGNGNYIARLGSTSMNSSRGNLRLYGPNGLWKRYQAVSANNFAYDWFYGENGTANLYLGVSGSTTNDGRIIVYDNFGSSQAGIYINGANQGIVWGDLKTFRMKHPNKSNTEIWYASIEGPEAAAYERGTSTLVNGEAFVEFSEHYQIVANPKTMTVNLTPLDWDTYGIAVVEKTNSGFKVKELKGGTGNFSFDWEVKCVRKGKESFKVIRSSAEMDPPVADVEDEQPGRFNEKVRLKKISGKVNTHVHSEGCVLNHRSN